MIILTVYFVGVIVGHVLLRRLIAKRKTRTDDTRRVARINPLFKWESRMYLRRIWLWPVYVFLIFPVKYTGRGIKWVFSALGFGEVYRDMYDAIRNY